MKSPSPVFSAETKNENVSLCPQESREDAFRRYSEEQANINQSNGKAVRKGKRIELQTRDRIIQLDDNCHNGEAYERYLFETHIQDKGYFLFRCIGYEWYSFSLINDRTGDKISLIGRPLFSPDRQRAISMSMDLEAYNMINAIRVYRFDPEGPKLEFEQDFGAEWGPSDPRWLSNSTIRFVKNKCDNPCTKYQSSVAFLVLKGNTWLIQDNP